MSEAEKVVDRFDSYTPEQHAAGIRAARDRAKARDAAVEKAAREAFKRMTVPGSSGLSDVEGRRDE